MNLSYGIKSSFSIFYKYKNRLEKSLRCFGKGNIVPIEIEAAVKFFWREQERIILGELYTQDGESFLFTAIDVVEESFCITFKNTILSSDFRFMCKKERDLLTIVYNGITYREVPNFGNVYSHTTTQQKCIEIWSKMDMDAGHINTYRKDLLLMWNYLHDIPEGFIGDMVTELKSINHEEEESRLMKEVVLLNLEPEFRKEITFNLDYLENKKGLFKLYEKMGYPFRDLFSIQENEGYLNMYPRMVYEHLCDLYRLSLQYIMPDGKLVYGYQVASVMNELALLKSTMDECFNIVLGYFKNGVLDENIEFMVGGEMVDYKKLLDFRIKIKTV